MKSTLENCSDHYPIVIIGGGIVGAGILRDLSLHNEKALLIDKFDFSSQTSQSSSKMLHGGIRYLENFDLELVYEGLQEKNLWLKNASHISREEKFYLPTYKDSLRPLWQVKIGLLLYDILSSFKNKPHGSVSKEKLLKKIPFLKKEGLQGAGFYHDGVIDDAKLTLDCLYDALLNPKVTALNYVSLEDVQIFDSGYNLTLKDEQTHMTREITCEQLVFAAGPFTDQLLSKMNYLNWSDKLIPSRGSHLWIKKESLPLTQSLVLTPKDGRVIFVIPHDDAILVGTTEIKAEVSFNQKPSQKEIDYLLENLNHYFTKPLDKEDIIDSYAGTRPLVKDPQHPNDPNKTARNHQIYRPHENTFVILGGKYTTFRKMAADLVKELLHKRKRPYLAHLSFQDLKKRSSVTSQKNVTVHEIEYIIDHEYPKTSADIIERRVGGAGMSEQVKELIQKTMEQKK